MALSLLVQGTALWATPLSLIVTVPLCLLLVRWYRKAVLKAMLETSGAQPAMEPESEPAAARVAPPAPARDLQVAILDASKPGGRPAGAEAAALYRRGIRAPRAAAGIYALAGAVHAAIALWLLFTFNEVEFLPRRTLVVYLVLLWPTVPTIVWVAAADRRLRIVAPLTYLGVALLLSGDYFAYLLALLGLMMGAPLIVFGIVTLKPWRTVGPWVFVMSFFMIFGILFGHWGYLRSTIALYREHYQQLGELGAKGIGLAAGLGVFAFWTAIGLGAFWLITRAYDRKLLSDQMLEIDVLWLIFTLFQCSSLAVTHGLLGLAGLAAFAGYLLVSWLGLRLLRRSSPRHENARLLLLRVFGSRRRSERLIEVVGTYWRYLGSVQMIAGTDLAAASLEPHEFLAFVTGRLRQRFVKSRPDLERKLEVMDLEPDPDRRYRVNEFFCHDTTWQPTLQALVRTSHSVLMDLRTFSRENRGCVFEIGQLLDLVPLRALVFLADETTDEAFLSETLRESWREVSPESPNRREPEPVAKILRLTRKPSRGEERRLLATLCEAGTAG